MDKIHLQTLIIDKLQADLRIAKDALRASHEAATHAESKAENKYDTRGLEAAYLADGQRRRVAAPTKATGCTAFYFCGRPDLGAEFFRHRAGAVRRGAHLPQ